MVIRRILLASGGTPDTKDVALTAFELARRHGAAVDVVTVFQPRVAYPRLPGDHISPGITPSDRHAADAQMAAVRRQVESVGASMDDCTITQEAGHIGRSIADRAVADDAGLVVMGNGRPTAADRHLGDRSAIAIAACLDRPLLAVASHFTGRPRRVMFAVGLDSATNSAGTFATLLFPEPDVACLAHVVPGPCAMGIATADAMPDATNKEIIQLDALQQALTAWPHARVETRMLTGDPVQCLLTLARDEHVDLIVGGLHGTTYNERQLMRNTALHLLAGAECSVLLVPVQSAATDIPAASLPTGGATA